ncbi:MAG: aquaporin [Acidimicrobiaceae bacterium]
MAAVTTTDEARLRAPVAQSEETYANYAMAARKYVVEAIGAFFLVFAVAMSGLTGSPLTPLAAGATLMVMVYAGGHISGGHFNPAVTMTVLCRRRLGIGDAVGYWIAQLVAGVVAAAAARAIVNPATVNTLHPVGHAFTAVALVELIFTFGLCYVVLNVATSKDQPHNEFYGLAVGFTVAGGALAVGSISGGSFNPAVSLGAATAGLFSWSTLWIYIVVQFAAGALAALTFLALNPGDR